MINPDITIKRGDEGKLLAGQFLDSHGEPVPLPGSVSRKVWMKQISAPENVVIDGATFDFADEDTGDWTYRCTADDVAVSGVYKLEFEVLRAGPDGPIKDTFPTDPQRPYLLVLIQDDLG